MRTSDGSPPTGPQGPPGSSREIAVRSAARIASRDGVCGVIATPVTALVAQVDEPRHPRAYQLAVQVDLDRDVLVVAFPAGVAPLPGPAQVHVVAAPGPLPAGQGRALAAVQVPADRPVQRRKRGRRGGHGPARLLPCVVVMIPACGGGAGLGEEFTVDRGCVPAPQDEPRVQLWGECEALPLLRTGPPLGTRRGQPAPHRPQRHPHRVRDQPHMTGRQLTPLVQGQQSVHRLLPREPYGNHRPRAGGVVLRHEHHLDSPGAPRSPGPGRRRLLGSRKPGSARV